MKKILMAVAAAVAMLIAVPVTASATEQDCAPFTTTVTGVSRPDSSANGEWATDSFDRTITATPDDGCGTWTLEFSDSGTFTTMPGALSPASGITLPAEPITGTFAGGQTFAVTAAAGPHEPAEPDAGWPSTSGWVALVFDDPTLTDQGWGWDYTTTCEQYHQGGDGETGDITQVCPAGTDDNTDDGTTDDNATGTTDDGTDDGTGDVVDTSGAADSAVDQTGQVDESADEQQLAETGVSEYTPYLIGGAVLLLAGGASLLVLARRRATGK